MKVAKTIQITASILAIVLWFKSFALFAHYDAVGPTTPDVVSGAIYSQFNHGHVVYLTAGEKHDWYGLMAAAGVCFVISAVLALHFALIKWSSVEHK